MVVAGGRQRGLSLVELMVAMTIGLFVLGALGTAYLAARASSRSGLALAQAVEDAGLALQVLRSHVAMAGYSRPVGPGPGQTLARAASTTAHWLFGCDGGFADLGAPIVALGCAPAGPDSTDALAVAYEADAANTLQDHAGRYYDCLGNTFDVTEDGGRSYYLSYSRFFVREGSLWCRGPGAAGPQVLVENVADLQFRYGVAGAGQTRVVRYLDATAVGAAAAWPQVVAVQVCLVMRSTAEVLDERTPYLGCETGAEPRLPADRRLYRAFSVTIALPNRLGAGL